MKIIVKANPRARKESVERLDKQAILGFDLNQNETDNNIKVQSIPMYKVSIKEAPVDGKANEAIVRVLAEYFKVSKSSVRLVSGPTSKQKVFEIDANIV